MEYTEECLSVNYGSVENHARILQTYTTRTQYKTIIYLFIRILLIQVNEKTEIP